MRGRVGVTLAGMLVLASAVPARAAEEATCVDVYLVCLNDATQAESWRTWKELGCAREYLACVRRAATGS